MEANQALILWPHWNGMWPDAYLLGEEELLSLFAQPFYTTTTQSNILLDELDALFELGDVLVYWDEMEKADQKKRGGEGEKRLPLQCYSEEKQVKTEKTRGDRGRTEEKALTFELVSRYFCMPLTQAARALNVGITVLKKRCRDLGIPRWPHRKIKSLQTLINNVQVLQEAGKENGEEQLRTVIEMLRQEIRLMEQKPYIQMEEKTKRLRQACFKANYKRRRLMAP